MLSDRSLKFVDFGIQGKFIKTIRKANKLGSEQILH